MLLPRFFGTLNRKLPKIIFLEDSFTSKTDKKMTDLNNFQDYHLNTDSTWRLSALSQHSTSYLANPNIYLFQLRHF